MSDEEHLDLPSTSEISPIGGSVDLLEMISQNVTLGNCLPSTTSNALTQVTYAAQNAAPSAAPFNDVYTPLATTTMDTFLKPFQTFVSPPSAISSAELNPRPLRRSSNSQPSTSQTTNPFVINPFVFDDKHLAKLPFATSRVVSEKDPNTHKSSSSRKKSKSHGSHKSSSRQSKSSKKESRKKRSKSSKESKHQSSSRKGHVSTRNDAVRSTTHTVTRTTNFLTDCTIDLTDETSAHTMEAETLDWLTVPDIRTAAVTCTVTTLSPVVEATGAVSYAVSRAGAPPSVISSKKTPYLPPNVFYSAPTIISRTPAAAASPAAHRVCEQFAVLPAQSAHSIPANVSESGTSEADAASRLRTRLVIPVSLNTYATAASSLNTTTASNVNRHNFPVFRAMQNTYVARTTATHASTTNTNTAMACALTHSPFALTPGATLYAARKFSKSRSHTEVTTEPRTFAIVDDQGTYTTLTISSNFTTTTDTPLVMTQTQTTTAVIAGVSNMLPVAPDSLVRPRSQLLIPITNTQMNTSTSISYLVTSPIGSGIITTRSSAAGPSTLSVATTTTSIVSHSTTINSESLNKIRNQVVYKVSNMAGLDSLPPSTMSTEGNRPRGPVTIISNRGVATAPRAMFSAASAQGLYAISAPITSTISSTSPAEPATRPVNRVMIPINLHSSSTSHSSVSTPATYFIAGVGPSPSAAGGSDAMTRSSRVVIPVIHSAGAATASTTCSPDARPCISPVASTDAHSRLRNRLTVQVNTTESLMPGTTTPITAYTITRNRAPQSVYAIPRTAPYISPTQTPEGTRNPATMTLITFASPSASGAPTTAAPRRSPMVTRCETPSPTIISAIPTLANTGNRYVIKLATGQSPASSASVSSVTAAISTPITSAALSPTVHRFVEPQPVSARHRSFPGPRTYSIAQRCATGSTPRPVMRNVNQRVKKMIPNPSPLQIFADVVCPPTTAPTQATAVATQSNYKSRITLSHSPGSSTLAVPQYKNTVFKNLSTIAQPNPERMSSRLLGTRVLPERLVMNRPIALVAPQLPAAGAASHGPRAPRSLQPDSTPVVSRAPPVAPTSTPSPASSQSSNQNTQNDWLEFSGQ